MFRIREIRKKKKISQQQIADHLGITQATFSGWESGKYEPDTESLKSLSELLCVSTDYLLGVTDFSDKKNILICANINKLIKNKKLSSIVNNSNVIIPIEVFERIKAYEYKFTHQALLLLSNFFDVPISELLKNEEEVSDFDMILYEEINNLTNDEKYDVLNYINYTKSKRSSYTTKPDYTNVMSENSINSKEESSNNREDGRKYTNITFEDNAEQKAALGGIPNNDDNTYTT